MKGIVDETLYMILYTLHYFACRRRHFDICLFPLDHRTLLMDVENICLLLSQFF